MDWLNFSMPLSSQRDLRSGKLVVNAGREQSLTAAISNARATMALYAEGISRAGVGVEPQAAGPSGAGAHGGSP
jgi:hypothetical protein